MIIPQIQPWFGDEEAEALRQVVTSGFVTENAQTARFEAMLCEISGAKHAIAYTNASCALFAVLKALQIGVGDEVIVPDLTFVASANAVILAGATPVFCDVEPGTMTIDVDHVATLVTSRTRAVMPVHLYGMSAEMDGVLAMARKHNLFVVEDSAQGIGVRWKGRHVGTFGDAGILSFYGNKTLTTGEGGAILTNDATLAEACYRLKNHGRRQKGVFVHESIGFNFSFTEMQAALGVVQLSKLDRVIAEKRRIRQFYMDRLGELELMTFQAVPPHVSPVFWFTNVFCDEVERLAGELEKADVQTRRFFYPLHRQPCYLHLTPTICPVSLKLYETGLSLPSWCGMEEKTLDRICDVILGMAAVA